MAAHIGVIGAGFAGLSAAIDLAAAGCHVTLFERAATVGGKARKVRAGNALIDAGPTVFSKRHVFDDLFEGAGGKLEDWASLTPASVLARHAWDGETARLDLFAERARTVDAIARFAGPDEARGFEAFAAHIRKVFETLDDSFMRAQKPGPLGLIGRIGPGNLADLTPIAPLPSMWRKLGTFFRDPRLQQLFGRYATYCGSSPFLAPATLMLVAHVEQIGVWCVEGGISTFAARLGAFAETLGIAIRCDTEIAEITVSGAGVTGVRLQGGEHIACNAVVCAADISALGAGCFGAKAKPAAKPVGRLERSLSAMVWSVEATTNGFPLSHHNVFFARDYRREFDELFRSRQVPSEPTVYVCAQDRGPGESEAPRGPERLQILINAPADGDTGDMTEREIARCETTTSELLNRCGLRIETIAKTLTTPAQFHRLFPATGGALYGRANHGPFATFRRPGARSRIPGLYLASGSAHPGPGVPMAALSGRLAAESLLADFASKRRHRPAAISGGISTGSAMTAPRPSPSSPS